MSRKRFSSEELADMNTNNIGLCESANMGGDDEDSNALVSSMDDSNLSDDSVHFNEEHEAKSSTSYKEEIRLSLTTDEDEG